MPKADEDERNRQIVDRAYKRHQRSNPIRGALIPILQDVQSEVGYLPETALKRVSDLLKLPPSHVYGVATFYHQFRLRPKGRHMITVCRGTACHVSGSVDVYSSITRLLRIPPREDTSQDGLFTVNQVRCLGACGLAPIVKVDDSVYGKVTLPRIRQILLKHTKQTREPNQ